MYFCPCSCDDPIDAETEENSFFTLPRNLSYVQDSYLDRYSVSARFVHNPKIERCIQHQQGQEWKANVEVETLGLLSAITAQELSGRCEGGFDSVSSSGFDFSRAYTSSSEAVTSSSPGNSTVSWSEGQSSSSCFTASSFFHPASVVASKISAFLHSPPNESMDSARDIGTSVDGDNLPLMSEASTKVEPLFVECPDSSGEDMERSDVLRGCSSISSPQSGGFSRDVFVAQEDSATVKCKNVNVDDCEIAISSGIFDDEFLENDISRNSSEVRAGINLEETDKGKANASFMSTFKSGDVSCQKPYDISGKTHFQTSNTSSDGDDVESVPENDSEVNSSNDPFLTKLNVVKHADISQGDVNSSIYEDDCSGNVIDVGLSALCGSPDSDAFSEEGVFVNTDDLDSTHEKSTTVSDTSDDTCISADSMFLSPDEGDLEEEDAGQETVRKMTLEEAISRAASDLNKMSLGMYRPSQTTSLSSKTTSNSSLLDDGLDFRFPPRIDIAPGRSSPIRISPGLKIKITDESGVGSQSHLTDSSMTLTDSPVYPDQEFNFSRVELRKSSSLKSNKTPPGTPHRKKVVRFADAMGLDLESVRHVLNMESPPKIPASALADLVPCLDEDPLDMGSKYLCPCFSQPGASDNFFTKVRNQKVSLENAIINGLTITGFVRVSNIAFHKSVRIRYTHNAWCSFYDIAASYVQNSCDGPTDRFSFSIVAPPYFGPNSRLEFAVCYIAEGMEFWDNNDGRNYVFECFAKSIPTDSETAWLHFL